MLSDGTKANVSCPSYSVAANDRVTCTYTASPTSATATSYAVVVTSTTEGVAGNTAMATITWKANTSGAGTVTLADPIQGDLDIGGCSQPISDTHSVKFEQKFNCSAIPSRYTNGSFTAKVLNTATLQGSGVHKTATAQIVITCKNPFETATGAGKKYPGSSNWFMYTGYTTSKVDLIAGQHHDAGDITMTRTSTHTVITIVTQNGFSWADVEGNLKIQDFDSEPKAYVAPGSFKYKFEVSGNTVKVSIPGTKAKFYGIHGDMRRPL